MKINLTARITPKRNEPLIWQIDMGYLQYNRPTPLKNRTISPKDPVTFLINNKSICIRLRCCILNQYECEFQIRLTPVLQYVAFEGT